MAKRRLQPTDFGPGYAGPNFDWIPQDFDWAPPGPDWAQIYYLSRLNSRQPPSEMASSVGYWWHGMPAGAGSAVQTPTQFYAHGGNIFANVGNLLGRLQTELNTAPARTAPALFAPDAYISNELRAQGYDLDPSGRILGYRGTGALPPGLTEADVMEGIRRIEARRMAEAGQQAGQMQTYFDQQQQMAEQREHEFGSQPGPQLTAEQLIRARLSGTGAPENVRIGPSPGLRAVGAALNAPIPAPIVRATGLEPVRRLINYGQGGGQDTALTPGRLLGANVAEPAYRAVTGEQLPETPLANIARMATNPANWAGAGAIGAGRLAAKVAASSVGSELGGMVAEEVGLPRIAGELPGTFLGWASPEVASGLSRAGMAAAKNPELRGRVARTLQSELGGLGPSDVNRKIAEKQREELLARAQRFAPEPPAGAVAVKKDADGFLYYVDKAGKELELPDGSLAVADSAGIREVMESRLGTVPKAVVAPQTAAAPTVVRLAVRKGGVGPLDENAELAGSLGGAQVVDPARVRILGDGEALRRGETLFYHGSSGPLEGEIRAGLNVVPEEKNAAAFARIATRAKLAGVPEAPAAPEAVAAKVSSRAGMAQQLQARIEAQEAQKLEQQLATSIEMGPEALRAEQAAKAAAGTVTKGELRANLAGEPLPALKARAQKAGVDVGDDFYKKYGGSNKAARDELRKQIAAKEGIELPSEARAVVTTLPKELASSAPRFGTRPIQFDTDLDKALYIIGNRAKVSKNDEAFISFAMKATGKDRAEVLKMGKDMRTKVKDTAGNVTTGKAAVKVTTTKPTDVVEEQLLDDVAEAMPPTAGGAGGAEPPKPPPTATAGGGGEEFIPPPSRSRTSQLWEETERLRNEYKDLKVKLGDKDPLVIAASDAYEKAWQAYDDEIKKDVIGGARDMFEEGGPLFQLPPTGGPLSETDSVEFLRKIGALEAAGRKADAKLLRDQARKEWFKNPTNLPLQIANEWREAAAGADLSFFLRQGYLLLGKDWLDAAVSGFRASVDENYALGRMSQLKGQLKQSKYVKWDSDKLFMSEMPGSRVAGQTARETLSKREETIAGTLVSNIPGYKNLAQANVLMLNELRARKFMGIVDSWENAARAVDMDKATFAQKVRAGLRKQGDGEALANFINRATGRGTMGQQIENSWVGDLLSIGFFSPRYQLSRPQAFLNLFNVKHPLVMIEAYKSFLSSMGATAGVLALANVGGLGEVNITDPTKSDFGRLKVGDTRFDPWAGFQPLVTITAKLLANPTGFKKDDINELQEFVEWTRNKLAPASGAVISEAFYGGEDTLGRELTPERYLASVAPIWAQGILEAYQEGLISPVQFLGTAADFVGLSAQTYPPSPSQVRQEIIEDLLPELYEQGVLPEGITYKTAGPRERERMDAAFRERYPDKAEAYDKYIKGFDSPFSRVVVKEDELYDKNRSRLDELHEGLKKGARKDAIAERRAAEDIRSDINAVLRNMRTEKAYQDAVNKLPDSDISRILDYWYRIPDSVPTKDGVTDWEAIELKQKAFVEFVRQKEGDQMAHRVIDNTKPKAAETKMLQLMQVTSQASKPYYDLPEGIQRDLWLVQNPRVNALRWLLGYNVLYSAEAVALAQQLAPNRTDIKISRVSR